MNAAETHRLQKQIEQAEENLRLLREELSYQANRNPMLGQAAWEAVENHPDVRAANAHISEMQSEVEEAQAEIGGVIFRVPEPRLEDLRKKIEKIGRRCTKLGIEAPTLTVTEEIEEEVKQVKVEAGDPGSLGDFDLTGETREVAETYRYVAVTGQTPRLAGWVFLATLQHEEAGTIVRRIPGLRAQMHGLATSGPDPRQAEEEVEAKFNLARFRECSPVCDHCHTRRARKDTYVVVNAESGEVKQVGSNCLADFVGGLSPQAAAKSFEYIWSALDSFGAAESEGYTGIKADPVYPTEEYLAHSALMVRLNGWTPRSREWETPTADQAESNYEAKRRKVIEKGVPQWIDPEDQDFETARAAIKFVRSKDFTGESDYVHNLKIALAGDYLNVRNTGLAASAILVYSRHIEREVAKKVEEERKAKALNEHFGEIKQRLELTLTCTKVIPKNAEYAYADTYYITTLVDDEGRTFKWFGSWEMEVGARYTGKWTVKDHSEWKGTKETKINRPTVEVVEEVNA